MVGLFGLNLRGTISIIKDKILLPINSVTLEIMLSSFTTVNDLSQFLQAQGISRIAIANQKGLPFNPNTYIKDIRNDTILLVLNNDYYKVMPSEHLINFSGVDLYDSLNVSARERKLIQSYIKNASKIFNPRSLIDKNQLILLLKDCINTGSYDYYNQKKKYFELISEYAKMTEEYNKMKKIGEKYAWRVLWGGFTILTLEWAYIGIGTYCYFCWDIMEPQAYVINFGNSLFIYAAFALRRQEISKGSMFQKLTQLKISRLSKDKQFDLEKYEQLSNKIKELKVQI